MPGTLASGKVMPHFCQRIGYLYYTRRGKDSVRKKQPLALVTDQKDFFFSGRNEQTVKSWSVLHLDDRQREELRGQSTSYLMHYLSA